MEEFFDCEPQGSKVIFSDKNLIPETPKMNIIDCRMAMILGPLNKFINSRSYITKSTYEASSSAIPASVSFAF